MRVLRVRPVVGAATIVLAASAVTAGCLAAATSAAVRAPAGPASPAGTGYSVTGALAAVAATSARNAWAVGTAGTASKALIVHWNGSRWTSVPAGAPAGTELRAVAASSASNAWALGEIYSGTGQAVILHWNGHAWKRVSFSAPAGTYLYSVSVTSPASAWAVGSYGTSAAHMLALHWNGSAWKRVSLPKLKLPQGYQDTALFGVSATSRRNAWAVGPFVSEAAGAGGGFALHWNGRSWKRVSSAPASAGTPVAVAATSARYAWLIGCPCQGGPGGAVTGLWNGHTWKTEPTPVAKAGVFGGSGNAIAAAGHLAWAAGAYDNTRRPMLLRWTGKAWKLTSVPTSKITIAGVAVTSATNAWAVGGTTKGKTLILHWNGSKWH
jgi:hypothetical protein